MAVAADVWSYKRRSQMQAQALMRVSFYLQYMTFKQKQEMSGVELTEP